MADLISAIAQLLWPLIALTAILVFRRAIGRVLRTAERRELEFDIGGQRVTMRELNDQQNEMIQDLQRQLSILSKQLEQREGMPPEVPTLPSPSAPPETVGAPPQEGELTREDLRKAEVKAPVGPEPFAVLWVAERPETHALLVEQLRNNGVLVTTARTTSEALAAVAERPYRLIVSDMSRTEGGQRLPDAGVLLVRELRDLGIDTPVVVFSSQQGQIPYATQAEHAGAVATTTSSYEMFRHFQNFGLL